MIIHEISLDTTAVKIRQDRYHYNQSKLDVVWVKESFDGKLKPSMHAAKIMLDAVVDSIPQPDLMIFSYRWRQSLRQAGVRYVRYMNASWYTYRNLYVEFKKKLP